MDKPHKWAKEICHMANGGEVEWAYSDNKSGWFTLHGGIASVSWDSQLIQFRIKPPLQDAAIVAKEAWYNATPALPMGCVGDSQNLFRWENAAKAVIKAYIAGQLDPKTYVI